MSEAIVRLLITFTEANHLSTRIFSRLFIVL